LLLTFYGLLAIKKVTRHICQLGAWPNAYLIHIPFNSRWACIWGTLLCSW